MVGYPLGAKLEENDGLRMKSRKSMFYLLAIVVVASLFFALVASTYADGEEIILSVPYYKQQSQFYCEYASLEMVFDYYGVDIPQQELVAVENMPAFQYASHGKATEYYWTAVVREAHFSNLSTSYERCEGFTITGYKERDLGYAAFWYASETCWLEELKVLIDEGYPIIVLQWFDFYEEAGHVRVVIGYDDTTGEVIFHDPWDRGQSALLYYGQGTTIEERTLGERSRLSYDDFISLWNYWGHYSATFVAPWEVDISVESVANGEYNVTATVTYPCPEPFDSWGKWTRALSTKATVSLPEGLTLDLGEEATKPGPLELWGGDSFTVSWNVVAVDEGEYTISVQAEGTIGQSPYLLFDGHGNNYIDRIGGVGEASLTAVA